MSSGASQATPLTFQHCRCSAMPMTSLSSGASRPYSLCVMHRAPCHTMSAMGVDENCPSDASPPPPTHPRASRSGRRLDTGFGLHAVRPFAGKGGGGGGGPRAMAERDCGGANKRSRTARLKSRWKLCPLIWHIRWGRYPSPPPPPRGGMYTGKGRQHAAGGGGGGMAVSV